MSTDQKSELEQAVDRVIMCAKSHSGSFCTMDEYKQNEADCLMIKTALLDACICEGKEKWQPIETAPKDGTCILVYIKSPVTGDEWQETVCYSDFHGMFMRGSMCVGHDFITHWMPLPEPPMCY